MIKMYINNEEVVSNKEFTISEEMLATPSTVLNNCYPALWENTKDYVSKFYFPKDYSKCIIGDGEFEKGSQRNIIKKVSGISPSFETNITKPWESLTIDGKSTQETRSGKNILNLSSFSRTTVSGITLTPNFVGNKLISITTSGTFSQQAYLTLTNTQKVQPNTTYVLSGGYSPSARLRLREYDSNNTQLSEYFDSGNGISFTSKSNVEHINIQVVFYASNPNAIFYPQLEKGDTATAYEPYTGGQPSPNPDYPSEIENVKGKNLFDKNKKAILINAKKDILNTGVRATLTSPVNWARISIDIGKSELLGKTITYGAEMFASAQNKGNIGIYFGSSTNDAIQFISNLSQTGSKTVTIPSKFPSGSDRIKILLYANTNGTGNKGDYVDYTNLMVVEGSMPNRYMPYGNIQIVETGKNLCDSGIYTLSKDTNSIEWGKNGSSYIPVKVGDTFSISYYVNGIKNENNTYGYAYAYQYLADGTRVNANEFLSSNRLKTATVTNTATKYIKVFYGVKGNKGTKLVAQVEKGSTATNYEPYTEEVVNIDLKGNELCSLPNGTKDELIVKDGRAKILKKIDEVVLDGSSGSFTYNRGINSIRYNDINDNLIDVATITTISNYFVGCSFNDRGNLTTPRCYFESHYLQFRGGEWTDTNSFKTWLSTHNTIVYYALAKPYEIDLGEVTLPNTLIGQNNVTLDATLETNMEISYYYSSYDLLFAGVVKKTGNISLNPRYPHYADIQVLDFKTFLSEGETLNFVIDNKTIGQAIDMVIDAIKSYGFVKGNIMLDDINEVIGAYSTDKKTAYDVFQYFSDITNSRWFTRMIDEDTVAIDFYDTDKLPVKPKIEYTEDWFCNNLIDDMSYSIKTDDYRNKQILLSDEVFGSTPYNDLLTSNGYDTSYTTTGKIASLTSAKIDDKNATFTTEANKEGGVEADIYYKPGEVGITTNNQIGAGKVIEITYIPLVEGREIIINDEEVNRIGSQLNRNGVISRYENRNDTTSSDELRQIGQTYIKYKGKAEVTLKITSRKNIYDIGDKVQFDAPLEDLSTEYMVKKKTTKYIVTANKLFYDYELSSSFNSESEINYFDNQRSKHKGNLSEGDYITRDIDITNSANIIWHDTSIDEISITGNNILDCALDSPFTD